MSHIRINLIDFAESQSGEVHGGTGDRLVAALSAEPETIAELQLALARFEKLPEGCGSLSCLKQGEDFEPYDAGIVIIDLAARIVMIDSSYSTPTPVPTNHDFGSEELAEAITLDLPDEPQTQRAGKEPVTYGIHYHDGQQLTEVYLPYRVPDDWLFLSSSREYKSACLERREARRNIVWRDARELLYGNQLCAFIAERMLAATDLESEELFSEIHAQWLTTAREDLGGRSPREVLLEKHEFVDFDLHSRQLQWAFTNECPPALLPNSYAYRFGGFGTHEIVVYYDLVRFALAAGRERLRHHRETTVEIEAKCLQQSINTWLETVNDEYQNKPPAQIIEWERKRLPMSISGKDAVVDDDCPVCQAMAEDLGPYFWHLDGSGMEDRFEFSFHKTQEEFDAERREWEEFSRKYSEQNLFAKSMAVRMA